MEGLKIAIMRNPLNSCRKEAAKHVLIQPEKLCQCPCRSQLVMRLLCVHFFSDLCKRSSLPYQQDLLIQIPGRNSSPMEITLVSLMLICPLNSKFALFERNFCLVLFVRITCTQPQILRTYWLTQGLLVLWVKAPTTHLPSKPETGSWPRQSVDAHRPSGLQIPAPHSCVDLSKTLIFLKFKLQRTPRNCPTTPTSQGPKPSCKKVQKEIFWIFSAAKETLLKTWCNLHISQQ